MDVNLSPRFFLPGWLIRSLTQQLCPSSLEAHVKYFQTLSHASMMPCLNAEELNALVIVVDMIQDKLFQSDGPSKSFTLDTSLFLKNAPHRQPMKFGSYARLLQLLGGVKLLFPSGGKMETYPLIETENWILQDGPSLPFLEIQLSAIGLEAFLGYSHSSVELVQIFRKERAFSEWLGRDPSLSLWKALWMELNPVEQALLIVLEKVMQWECGWLHFNGSFGERIIKIHESLRGTPKSSDDDGHSLASTAAMLKKLGRRLHEHGLIRSQVEDEFLAFSPLASQDPMLIWQLSDLDHFAKEHQQFKTTAIRCIEAWKMKGVCLDDWLKVLLGKNSFEDASGRYLRRAWQSLSSNLSDMHYQDILGEGGSCPVMALPVFLEWHARQLPDHPLALPSSIGQSILGKLSRDSNLENLKERFETFFEILVNDQKIKSAIPKIPFSSFHLRDTQKNIGMADYLEKLSKPISASEVTFSSANALKSSREQPKVAATPIENSSTNPVKKSISEQSLKKLAVDELNRIRSGDPERYLQLKNKYFLSLETSKRQLIMDVQNRMQPSIFDQHIQSSLVRYMIENPSTWKSMPKPTFRSHGQPQPIWQ